jgi:hypothetical protein
MVNKDSIVKINRNIAKKFPEMTGKRPVVRRQTIPNGSHQYLLTYKGHANLPGGRKLSRIVRVVADERGRILRISTSK